MPGYILVEHSILKPYKAKGIAPLKERIGVLDFLREISQDELPFPKYARMHVVGLDEVLFKARPDEAELAVRVHSLLRKAAQALEGRLCEVQVVLRGKIVRGDELYLDYREARLPIGHIFGSPPRQRDSNGNPYYKTNFNLTNG